MTDIETRRTDKIANACRAERAAWQDKIDAALIVFWAAKDGSKEETVADEEYKYCAKVRERLDCNLAAYVACGEEIDVADCNDAIQARITAADKHLAERIEAVIAVITDHVTPERLSELDAELKTACDSSRPLEARYDALCGIAVREIPEPVEAEVGA